MNRHHPIRLSGVLAGASMLLAACTPSAPPAPTAAPTIAAAAPKPTTAAAPTTAPTIAPTAPATTIAAPKPTVAATAATAPAAASGAAAGAGWHPNPNCKPSDPAVQAAIDATVKRTGPQSQWNGPSSAPKPQPGTKVVYIPTDAQNALSKEWGDQIQEAAKAIKWDVAVIDGKGTAQGWTSALTQAIALKPAAIMTSMDVATVKDLAAEANSQGIKVIGIHGVALPGPAADVGLFDNITSDPHDIGKAEADYVIADSCGQGKAVVLYDGNYDIARTKAAAMRDQLMTCKTCQLLDYVDSPLSEITTRTPQVFSTFASKYGKGWYVMTIYDGYYDFGIPALQSGGIGTDEVKLVGSDGTKEAYDRIRSGSYQVATVPEPPSLQAYQALDDAVRAAASQPAGNWTQPVFLVVKDNIQIEGGPDSIFVPSNDFKNRYLKLWGVQ
jgi:ribose transport system substrate-binding protein